MDDPAFEMGVSWQVARWEVLGWTLLDQQLLVWAASGNVLVDGD
jgi:hypothetical protein